MNDNTALQVRDLRVQIETDTATLDILHGISFDIYKGETLGIVGESGCGKSMTALSIMRLTQPNAKVSGSITLDGQSLLDMPMKDFRKIRGNRVSMIFQEPMTSLNPVFTIGNQLEEAILLHTKKNRAQAKARAIEMGDGQLRVIFPEVAGEPEGFDQIQRIILDILPCHLGVEFYFRYLTWQECEDAGYTWAQVEAAEHTWETFQLAVPPEE